MATFNATDITRSLKVIFGNGSIDVGLEVGADKGLPVDQYIQIPASMRKACVVRIDDAELADAANAGMIPQGTAHGRDIADGDTVATLSNEAGWVAIGRDALGANNQITRWMGGLAYRGITIDQIFTDAPTADDARRFYEANIGHINAGAFDADQIDFILKVRFWAVVTGLVVAEKNAEWVEVPDPGQFSAASGAFAAGVADFAENAITAVAARSASYRKSGHATGGPRLTGFPLRFMTKMEMVPNLPDRAARDAALLSATNCFYIATHGASVHAALAILADQCEAHWSTIDIRYGAIRELEVRPSVSLRIAPNTQVAGGALVADSVAALKAITSENLAPLLASAAQIPALLAAYSTLEAEGVRAATYARWFLDGHPNGMTPIAFDQKASAFSEIVGELACVATRYYSGTTLGKSPSLANAVEQLASDAVRQTWTTLGARKSMMTSAQVIEAVNRIKGAGTLNAIQGITATAEADVRAGVTAYNTSSRAIHTMLAAVPTLAMPQFSALSGDVVWANAQAQAAAAAAAAATVVQPPP